MADELSKDAPAGKTHEPAVVHMASVSYRELYEFFGPTREYIRASGKSQEELLADIDAAIAEVRAERRHRAKRANRPDGADSD